MRGEEIVVVEIGEVEISDGGGMPSDAVSGDESWMVGSRCLVFLLTVIWGEVVRVGSNGKAGVSTGT